MAATERARIARLGGKAGGGRFDSKTGKKASAKGASLGGRASPTKFNSETGAAAGKRKKKDKTNR